jgi:uncharacterized protein YbjT (DUF2867 family)
MKIVLTGSLGNIGKLLAPQLIAGGHELTIISSNPERRAVIEALGAKAAIGQMQDVHFLTEAFNGADLVYLMESMESVGDIFDPNVDFIAGITAIGQNYQTAIQRSGVKRVIHLSSIGAHMNEGNGILLFHHQVEQLLRQMPADIAIKFIRPVGFYLNLFSFIPTIKNQGKIVSNYGGDRKEPWVSPADIAEVIAEEVDIAFAGRSVRYVASDEVSPNEVAAVLGQAIGQPDLQWTVIPGDELLNNWLKIGFNPQVARGFIELQAGQGSGKLYEDYEAHRPVLGKVKLADFAKEFAEVYLSE